MHLPSAQPGLDASALQYYPPNAGHYAGHGTNAQPQGPVFNPHGVTEGPPLAGGGQANPNNNPVAGASVDPQWVRNSVPPPTMMLMLWCILFECHLWKQMALMLFACYPMSLPQHFSSGNLASRSVYLLAIAIVILHELIHHLTTMFDCNKGQWC
jgi:hypothetical protein